MTHVLTLRRFSSVLLLVLSLLVISCGKTEDEEMKPEEFRMSLNGDWSFRTDPDNRGIAQRWFGPQTDLADWGTQRVPGFWDDLQGMNTYDGIGWYVRRFDAKRDVKKKYALVFDAVDDNADIWLNEKRIGSHAGVGERFYFDVTTALRDTGNVLAVRIEDLAGPGGLSGNVTLREYENEAELMQSEFHDMQPVASPGWVKDAVIYEVYLRSFSPEGTFRELQDRLPELEELGATVLWLMPIHPIGEKHRKGSLGSPYSVQDYYAIDPAYGSLDDFRALVDAVHAQGMHIIMDLVANHTAWDNPLITEHPEWYMHNAAGEIIPPNPHWYDVADLDYTNRDLRAWMKGMMLYWVRDVGVDGYRCDVAELVPYDFWVDATAALRKVKPVMMLAEGSDPQLHIDAFDLTYAWNTYDILRPILREDLAVSELAPTLKREFFRYPKGALRLRFTTNHDKNKEDGPAAALYGAEAAKAAAVLMATLPGVPLVYNGQEVGNTKKLSLFERVPIDWSKDPHGFRKMYERLLNGRANHDALRRGEMRLLPIDRTNQIFAFVRELDKEAVVTIVNMSDERAAGRVDLPVNVQGQPLLIGGEAELDKEGVSFDLPPYGYLVLY